MCTGLPSFLFALNFAYNTAQLELDAWAVFIIIIIVFISTIRLIGSSSSSSCISTSISSTHSSNGNSSSHGCSIMRKTPAHLMKTAFSSFMMSASLAFCTIQRSISSRLSSWAFWYLSSSAVKASCSAWCSSFSIWHKHKAVLYTKSSEREKKRLGRGCYEWFFPPLFLLPSPHPYYY